MEHIRDCISFQASAAAKTIARLSRARLSPFGVTPIQFAVLQAVSEADRPTAAEVGAALMIDSATIVGVIDRLEGLNLLMREADPADRRLYRLLLTSHGVKSLPAMQAGMDELNDEIDAELSQSAPSVRKSLQTLAALQTK
ncbi:MarR family winged helix-turn-helix transcriptional regulator [Ruegeria sp. MALMAid1280]|uniref:MarR family winged helix-turn-helix transcriptional regulator n=1 Tax=Ruegeria sp. MALMAid1280 TaxID=3411634 RepID=UPI003B9FA8E5